MSDLTPVELADRYSRKRSIVIAAGTLAFVLIQATVRPVSSIGDVGASRVRTVMWAINAVVLLAVLATGGGLLNSRKVRALLNDELSRSHRSTAMAVGYWVAMFAALGLYVAPGSGTFSGRDAAYVIVTASVAISLLTFAYLEHRAQGNE